MLPPNTRIVGEGVGPGATTSAAPITTLQAASTFSGDMIDMGDPAGSTTSICGSSASTANCKGIILEHLALDAHNVSTVVNAVFNGFAQELNSVHDVKILNVPSGGYGLTIAGQGAVGISKGTADNSGPYSQIYFNGSGTCVNVNGPYGIRRIFGLTCIGNSSSNAVLLDGGNTTIQDIFISGYSTGILIGSRGTTYSQNDLLFNVKGDTNVSKVVDIKTASAPTDITLMGITSYATSGIYTIYDEVMGAHLSEQTVGLYILGEPTPGAQGFSRFTTSSSLPTWFVGPSGVTACSSPGSLYSITAPISSGATLYECIAGNSADYWYGLNQ